MTSELDAAFDLFLYWLRETRSLAFQRNSSLGGSGSQPDTGAEGGAPLVSARDGNTRLTASLRSLLPSQDAKFERQREMLESLIAHDLPARVALWCPAGADLPSEEPDVSEFGAIVRQSALKLGPHERSYVQLPAKLFLRKNSESGNVISVTGGLNPHWARFTDRVRGQYDLDSTQLHRLPESAEHLEALLNAVVEKTQTLDVGQYATIDTIDAWTVQRLSGDSGVTIVGLPSPVAVEGGIAVRRNLRRILADTIALRETPDTL